MNATTGAAGGWWSRWRRADVPVRNWTDISSGTPTRWIGFDETLAWVIAGLISLGLVMVYSASIQLPDNPKYANYASTHFMVRHVVSIALAIVAACVTLAIPMRTWEKVAPWLFVVALLLLVAVLIPGIGKVVNRSRRWIPLGIMNFQPSELAKLAMAMYAANYMMRKMDVKESFTRAVLPMAIALGVVGLLLLAEPDMGAFMVIAIIAMGILFLGGVNGRVFTIMVGVLLSAFVLVITLSPEKRSRIFGFMDPWSKDNAEGKAYQLTHSLIAFGRGEIFGQGLGQSVEKLHYHEDAPAGRCFKVFAARKVPLHWARRSRRVVEHVQPSRECQSHLVRSVKRHARASRATDPATTGRYPPVLARLAEQRRAPLLVVLGKRPKLVADPPSAERAICPLRKPETGYAGRDAAHCSVPADSHR